MKLGVITNAYATLSFEEALTKLEAIGIEALEIGCGGYPGDDHAKPKILLSDEKAFKEFQTLLQLHHLSILTLQT